MSVLMPGVPVQQHQQRPSASPPTLAAISHERKQAAPRPRRSRTRRFVLGLLVLVASALFAADINWRSVDDSLGNVIHLLQKETTMAITDDTRKDLRHQYIGDEYRLELLHIPKTGGTMLEVLALEHNITWGACHFEFPWRTKPKCILRNCPRPLMRLSSSSSVTTASSAAVAVRNSVAPRNSSTTYWHYPHQFLREDQEFLQENNDFQDPYDSLGVGSGSISAVAATGQAASKRKQFFVVVRNPYDRYVSLFYMRCECPPYTEQALNDFVQKTLMERDPLVRFHCQHDFVLDNTKTKRRRIVDHDQILHFEQLKREFEHLANDRYGMNLVVPAVKPPSESKIQRDSKKFGIGPKMGPHNFTQATLRMIHAECGQDFDLGPYKMLPVMKE
jgi:Sulfotransferase family